MASKQHPTLTYGCNYQPEERSEEAWCKDIELMKHAGINSLKVECPPADVMNPAAAVFAFSKLQQFLDLLKDEGIEATLVWDTGDLPTWLMAPQTGSLGSADRSVTTDERSSPPSLSLDKATYLAWATDLARALAKALAKHPALKSWQVQPVDPARLAQMSTGTNKNLEAGTGEPTRTLDTRVPNETRTAMIAAWRSVANDRAGLHRAICEALTEAVSGILLAVELAPFSTQLANQQWARHAGLKSGKVSAPDPTAVVSPAEVADYLRPLCEGAAFTVGGFSTTQGGPEGMVHVSSPGALRLACLQAIAHGAEGVHFAQWQQSPYFGIPKGGAMLPAVQPLKSRIFKEICSIGDSLHKLGAVSGSGTQAECALMIDWQSMRALESEANPRDFDFLSIFKEYHEAFSELNIPVDIISPSTDLSRYRAVLAPNLYLLKDTDAEKISAYIKAGGLFVLGFCSGILSEQGLLGDPGVLSFFQKTMGIWVEEREPETQTLANGIKMRDGRLVKAGYLSERVHLEGAEALGHFSEGMFAGSPALTAHRYGRGMAYYIATRPKASFYRYALEELAEQIGLQRPPVKVSPGVEVSLRQTGKRRFLFLLNWQEVPSDVELIAVSGTDLLSGKSRSGRFKLDPRDAAVIELSD